MRKSPFVRALPEDGARRRGFTLVELMVAMAVLVIIGVLLGQIISATSRTTVLSNRNVDAAAQARIAFDRIQLDVAGWVKREDVDCILQNPPPNASPPAPLMQFFSSVTSFGITPKSNNRSMSLIAYEVCAHPDNADPSKNARLCLARAGMPIPWEARPYTLNGSSVNWGSAAFMGLKSNGLPVRMDDPSSLFPSALLPQSPSVSSPGDFDVLAAGVVRMVVGFQLFPDDEKVSLSGSASQVDSKGQIVYSPPLRKMTPTSGVPTPVDYVDPGYVASLVIGVVAIDSENLRILSAQNIRDIAAAFPTPDAGILPVKSWSSIAGKPGAFPSAIPLPARQSIRIYQRAFPLNSSGQNGY